MISFRPPPAEAQLLKTLGEFSRDELRPLARGAERDGLVPRVLRKTATMLGIPALGLPRLAGGAGHPLGTLARCAETLAWGDPWLCLAVPGLDPATRVLASLVDAGVAMARTLAERQITDPTAGTALALFDAPEEPLVVDESRGALRLSGCKRHVLRAATATSAIVLGRDDSGAPVLVLVPTLDETFSAEIRPRGAGNALDGGRLEMAGFLPEDAHVAMRSDAALGLLGDALRQQQVLTAATQVGLAQAALDYTGSRAGALSAFGRTLKAEPAAAVALVDAHTALEAARLAVWRAAAAFDAELDGCEALADAAFATACEAATRATDLGLALLGPAAATTDHPLEKWSRDTRALALLGATASICDHGAAAGLLGASSFRHDLLDHILGGDAPQPFWT